MDEVAAPDLASARDGDAEAVTRLVAPLRGELHAHCYRMLGSVHDADDAVRDTLRHARRGPADHGTVRTWLYTEATRTCLDMVAAKGSRVLPADLGPASEDPVLDADPRTDVAWLGPYPDIDLTDEPTARYQQREAAELAFVAACQHLPGDQRAALLLSDVLGFPAAEIAGMTGMSTRSVDSALAAARQVVPDHSQQRTLRSLPDARLRELVTGFATALDRGEPETLVALLTGDVTWSMPPLPHWYRGIDAVTAFALAVTTNPCASWRHRTTTANGQPAVALYLGADAQARHDAWSITVLTVHDGRISDLTSFLDPAHFAPLGLPTALPPA